MNHAMYPLLAAALIAAAGCDARNEPPTTTPADGTPNNATDRDNIDNDSVDTPTPTPRPDDPNVPGGTVTISDAQVLSILRLVDDKEAAMGRMAQEKATSDAAKELADALVDDHTEHAGKVAALAEAENIALSDEASARQVMDRLKGGATAGPDPMTILRPLSGAEFDRRFGELMAQGHRDLIRILEATRSQLTNTEVRALVDETIPVLREHETMARAIGAPTTP